MNKFFKTFARVGTAVAVAIVLLSTGLFLGGASSAQKEAVDVSAVRVPEVFGTIKETHGGTNNKTVFHIQDAHCNFEAQNNSANILRGMIDTLGIGVVAVEGSSGELDVTPYSGYPNKKARDDVAFYFLQQGRLSGAAYLAITDTRKFKIFGIEDPKLYKENFDIFIKSLTFKNSAKDRLGELKGVYLGLMQNMYSPDLKGFNSIWIDYRDGKTKFTDFAKTLHEYAGHLKIDMKDYKNLNIQKEAQALEQLIDFDKVEKERGALIDALGKKVARETLSDLVTKSLSFRLGRISSDEYYASLKNYAAKAGLDIKDYPNLSKYVDYLSLFAKMDKEALLAEADKLEGAIKDLLFVDKEQRELDKTAKDLDILGKLFDLKLSINDYRHFKEQAGDFNSKRFLDFAKKYASRYGIFVPDVAKISVIDDNLVTVEKFYDVATKRDEVLVKNAIDTMEKDGLDRIVMVTGGFHTEGIKEQLKAKGYSYVIITPRITKFDTASPYIDVMTGKETPLEEMLTGGGMGASSLSTPEKERLDSPRFNAVFTALVKLDSALETEDIDAIEKELTIVYKANHKNTPPEGLKVVKAVDGAYYYYIGAPKTGAGVVYRIARTSDKDKLPFGGMAEEMTRKALAEGRIDSNTFGNFTVTAYEAKDAAAKNKMLAYIHNIPARIAAGTPGDPMSPAQANFILNHVNNNQQIIDSEQDVPALLKDVYAEVTRPTDEQGMGIKFSIVASKNPRDTNQLALGKKESYGNYINTTQGECFVMTREAFNMLKDPDVPENYKNAIALEIRRSLRHERTELEALKTTPVDPSVPNVYDLRNKYAHIRGLMAECGPGQTIPSRIDTWLRSLIDAGDTVTIKDLIKNTGPKEDEIKANPFFQKDRDASDFAVALAEYIKKGLADYTDPIVTAAGLQVYLGDLGSKVKSHIIKGNTITLVNANNQQLNLELLDYGDNLCVRVGNETYIVRNKAALDLSRINPLGNPKLLGFFDLDIKDIPEEHFNFAMPVDSPWKSGAVDLVPANRVQQPALVANGFDQAVVDSARGALGNPLSLKEQLNNIAIVGINGAVTMNRDDYYLAQKTLNELIDSGRYPQQKDIMVGLADHMLFTFCGCDWLRWQKYAMNLQKKAKEGELTAAKLLNTFFDDVRDGLRVIGAEVEDAGKMKPIPIEGHAFDLGAQAIDEPSVEAGLLCGGASTTVRRIMEGKNKIVGPALKVKILEKIGGVKRFFVEMINIFQARIGYLFGQNLRAKVLVITSNSGSKLGEPDEVIYECVKREYPNEFANGQINLVVQRLGLLLDPKTGYPIRFKDGHAATCAENHEWAFMARLMDKDGLLKMIKETNGIISIGNGDNILNYTREGMVGTLLEARENGKSLATVAVCVPAEGDTKCGVGLKITYFNENTGKTIVRTEFRETNQFPTRSAGEGYGAVVIPSTDSRYADYEKDNLFAEDMLKGKHFPVNVAFYAVDLKLIVARLLGFNQPLKDIPDKEIVDRLSKMDNAEWTKIVLALADKVGAVERPSKGVPNELATEERKGWMTEAAIQDLIVNGLRHISNDLEAEIQICKRSEIFLPYKGVPGPIFDENGAVVTNQAEIDAIKNANAKYVKKYGEKVVKGNEVYDLIANMRFCVGKVAQLAKVAQPARKGLFIVLGRNKTVVGVENYISLDVPINAARAPVVAPPAAPVPASTVPAERMRVGAVAENVLPVIYNQDVYFGMTFKDDGGRGAPREIGYQEFGKHFIVNLRVAFDVPVDIQDPVTGKMNTVMKTLSGDLPAQLVGKARDTENNKYDYLPPFDQTGYMRFVVNASDIKKFITDKLSSLGMKSARVDVRYKPVVTLPNRAELEIAMIPEGDLKTVFTLAVPSGVRTPEERQKDLDKLYGTPGADYKQCELYQLLEQVDSGRMRNLDLVVSTLTAGLREEEKYKYLPAFMYAINTLGSQKSQVIGALPIYINEQTKAMENASAAMKPLIKMNLAVAKAALAALTQAEDIVAQAKDVKVVSLYTVGGKQEFEVAGGPVAVSKELEAATAAESVAASLTLKNELVKPMTITNLLMELAARKYVEDNDPYLRALLDEKNMGKLIEPAKKANIQQINISLDLIASKEGNTISSRGVGFARVMKRLAAMGIHVNIISPYEDDMTREILLKGEGIGKEIIDAVNAKNERQMTLVKAESIKDADNVIKGSVANTRWLIDKNETDEAYLRKQGYKYFAGTPGISMAALVTVIMTSDDPNKPENRQKTADVLLSMGVPEDVVKQYLENKDGQPVVKTTESVLKNISNNKRSFDIAA